MIGSTTWTKALAAAVAASIAFAAQAAPGNGIRLGGSDARLHPFLDLEARYDSNVAYTPANQAISDLILHVRPGLELKAPSELAAFEFSGALDWAQYMGADADTSNLSKLYANAALAAVFNRAGVVSPRVDNTFARQVSTTSLSAAAAAVISNQNTLTLSVPWKPGGGALVVAANGQWMVETYEKYGSVSPGNLADLGYNQYRGGAELQWRFLPRTSGLLQGGYYARVPNASNRPGDATGYDVLAGVTGLMTQRISATAKAGFGATTTKDLKSGGTVLLAGETASSFLADLSAEWAPFDTFSVNAGYTRTLGIDPTVSAYTADGVGGGFKAKLAERFLFRTAVRFDHLTFKAAAANGATTDFLRIDPAVEGAFGRWLKVAVGYVYSSRTSSWDNSGLNEPPAYAKNEAYLRVGFTY
jgi:hypothetical protein